MKTQDGSAQLSTAWTIPAPGASLETILMKAASYIAAGKAPNTVRAYESDWRHFANWCVRHGRRALPAAPLSVALYCADLAEIAKASTIARHLATIAKGHAIEGYESPCSLRHAAVADVLAGIRGSKGTMAASKSPLMVEDLRRIISALPKNTIGTRDVALLLFGFSGGFRRSELAALAVEDIEDTTEA